MSIDRRNFFKVLGLSGMSLALGKQTMGGASKADDVEFNGILYDSTRCEGCQSCEFACAEANGLPAPEDYPETGITRSTSEHQRTVINAYETPKGIVYVKRQCMHCNQPACTAACLTKAMEKHYQGPVTWDGNKCMGCRYCMVSCPFDMPKFEYHSSNPEIVKCNMCYQRVNEGGLPACVENCPAEALTFGKRRDLIAEARQRIHENPNRYVNHIFGEYEAGGTGFLYLSPVPFSELGFNTNLKQAPYPELSRGFLYSVPAIFVLWPMLLLGLQDATKADSSKTNHHE